MQHEFDAPDRAAPILKCPSLTCVAGQCLQRSHVGRVLDWVDSLETPRILAKFLEPWFITDENRWIERFAGTTCIVFEFVVGQITEFRHSKYAADGKPLFRKTYNLFTDDHPHNASFQALQRPI